MKIFITAVFFFGVFVAIAQNKTIEQRVDSLMQLMTLKEKIGQMNQYNGPWASTGEITNDNNLLSQISEGLVSSMLNVPGVKRTRQLQELAMQSRLKIPLLFGQDVIHGYRTIFPIPLAEAASWDMELIEQAARAAATEVAASGVHWTFAPMVDISRDPRWGRVMEGAGEDPYLGSQIAIARVKGFQGKGFGNTDAVMACAKHFAAYGAAIGGRDYNSVDMSLTQLNEIYLPPFKAAAEAGVATFMNGFNDLNGIPVNASSYLQRDLLKGAWNFKGFVVSDWASIGDMVKHGYAKDNYQAALQAINAGSDMDMESRSYLKNLEELVKQGKVKIALINDAVKRILTKKFEMGLFEDPFKFSDSAREKKQWNNPEHIKLAREIAKKSMILLKNENQVLPLSSPKKQTIAFIGPFVKAKNDHNGFWSYDWPDDSLRIVSLWDAVQQRVGKNTKILYAQGCNINDSNTKYFADAIQIANQSDIIVACIGEARDMSGEARSRSNIHLPGVQEALINELVKTGKPVIVLISAGRPLVFNNVSDKASAVLYTWWLGTQAGNAMADVLFGDYNPSGKLPITFPLSEGQIPIYYNHFNTGHPATSDSNTRYRSAYTDLSIFPKYAFGYGLSYTKFEYGEVQLSKNLLKIHNDSLIVSAKLSNTGNYDGEEVVQLYTRDLVGKIIRPVKELKGFKKIFLKKGETQTIQFVIKADMLKFFDQDLNYAAEPGDFKVFIGGNSRDVKENSFKLVE